ncbi:PQQ-binding-like beta-propeller repeat protein [Tamlana haliotis]|uniref:PQQ-binding-like beta-propeller repeat protein n=1 Tax=Pseudotamlana haliotis TaxID=2614804 RepID=A0A6N6MFP9_9FLAO|nr:PQQ-binding-like beta-propeller repeat protein [Tamlana haliotis]KAB1068628.1 PQQ-binding-like beta-propeller repeat protein [Tamlana haliotis]
MFKKVTKIDDVYSCPSINDECIVYYSSKHVLKFFDIRDLTLKFEHQFTRDFDCKLINSHLYISVDSDLLSLDVENLKLEKVCKSNDQYIMALSNHRYISSSYRRKDKKYDNSIYDQSCKLLLAINGEMSFRNVYQSHLLLSNRGGNKIAYLNFENCNILWQTDLNSIINGESIETKKYIIIPMSDSLIAFDRQSGEKVWSNKNSLSHYSYAEQNDNLYGITGNFFEVIDANTGKKEVNQKFSENLHIASHLTFNSKDLLYFSGYRDTNIPVFGAVNVKSGKLEFIQEVKIEGEKSFRIGLEKPIVVDNKLYVKDSLNTLHIFKKETTSTDV